MLCILLPCGRFLLLLRRQSSFLVTLTQVSRKAPKSGLLRAILLSEYLNVAVSYCTAPAVTHGPLLGILDIKR
ncbi:hypothetical protein OBBRIDRAFT_793042 [Obba rivulosa]|uniref:Secreted protein n=1 Tax=Obba rivulosa TaxID=1052685 RepID=A0A8E2AYU4_9APHY|nr:hypothetical protein OBBRIDRAFT_793042 [Obba rivulosa]